MKKSQTLALSIEDPVLKEVITDALDRVNFSYETVEIIENIASKKPFFGFLSDENVNLTRKSIVFGFFGNKKDEKQGVLSNFNKKYDFPIRLGRVIDDLSYFLRQTQLKTTSKPIKMGTYTLKPQSGLLYYHGSRPDIDEEIRLTDKEQEILIYLFENKQTKTLRDQLLQHVWEYAEGVETHTLETHIYRLRQKIEGDPTSPDFLMTDDEGYYLNITD